MSCNNLTFFTCSALLAILYIFDLTSSSVGANENTALAKAAVFSTARNLLPSFTPSSGAAESNPWEVSNWLALHVKKVMKFFYQMPEMQFVQITAFVWKDSPNVTIKMVWFVNVHSSSKLRDLQKNLINKCKIFLQAMKVLCNFSPAHRAVGADHGSTSWMQESLSSQVFSGSKSSALKNLLANAFHFSLKD
jgi:hypothetical protein